ncbi:hypothetical protein P872_13920 [Rhodonellum psychrophilum GCM71 = DSM 17998]|uniref:Uncharacterized protein n=1 Tax=Rhodonellum psychrophilum GCM71 = DSM 17998 TaxID=1123057 RepID=U5BRZ8_9BACT|nr:hypothetical protein P872_13920 [Rhodonellum psychrophilum GCM71 = DSM 17998]
MFWALFKGLIEAQNDNNQAKVLESILASFHVKIKPKKGIKTIF